MFEVQKHDATKYKELFLEQLDLNYTLKKKLNNLENRL